MSKEPKKSEAQKSSEKRHALRKAPAGGNEQPKSTGFLIPRTIEEAKASGLALAKIDSAAFTAMMNNGPITISDNVPVGHLWHLGEVHGNMVYACYKTSSGGCDWVEVPSNNIPQWDPNGPQ